MQCFCTTRTARSWRCTCTAPTSPPGEKRTARRSCSCGQTTPLTASTPSSARLALLNLSAFPLQARPALRLNRPDHLEVLVRCHFVYRNHRDCPRSAAVKQLRSCVSVPTALILFPCASAGAASRWCSRSTGGGRCRPTGCCGACTGPSLRRELRTRTSRRTWRLPWRCLPSRTRPPSPCGRTSSRPCTL